MALCVLKNTVCEKNKGKNIVLYVMSALQPNESQRIKKKMSYNTHLHVWVGLEKRLPFEGKNIVTHFQKEMALKAFIFQLS